MKIFNLAEELEKERKKNKELKLEIEDLKEQVVYQDIWRKEYSNRIDKAIELIEENYSLVGVIIDNETGNFGFNGDACIKEKLLKILKGDSND